MGFTKLDSGIVDSSIWSEPNSTRVVWITFLAKCNSNGFVGASHSGMQRACNVSTEEFNKAVKTLESADPDSRTPDFDGRRIEKVDGGWNILNYKKYREYSYSDNPEAVRKREYRNRDNMGHVPKSTGHSASASSSVSASCIKEGESGEKAQRNIVPPKIEWVRAYCEERKNGINPQTFFDHYEARGWKPKGYTSKMKDWQAAIRTWEKSGSKGFDPNKKSEWES